MQWINKQLNVGPDGPTRLGDLEQRKALTRESEKMPETAVKNVSPRLQWTLLGQICDRICFVLYVIYFIVTMVLLFPRPDL